MTKITTEIDRTEPISFEFFPFHSDYPELLKNWIDSHNENVKFCSLENNCLKIKTADGLISLKDGQFVFRSVHTNQFFLFKGYFMNHIESIFAQK